MKRHPKRDEAETQTVLQCTPHLLRVGDRAVVQSAQYTQTIATAPPDLPDIELYPQLVFVDKLTLRQDAIVLVKARRHRRLKFNLPDLADDDYQSFSINSTRTQLTEDTILEEEGEEEAEGDTSADGDGDASIDGDHDIDDDDVTDDIFEIRSDEKPSSASTLKSEVKIPSLRVRAENEFMDDKVCQTRLMVFPHFLRRNEIASVFTDISIQTSVTCQPECSVSEIIPMLKSYLEHEGQEVAVTVGGDNDPDRCVLDLIRGIIKDVENSHNHMFDDNYRPPKVPDELKRLNKKHGTSVDTLGKTATDDSFKTAKGDSNATLDADKCPECKDSQKRKDLPTDKVCQAHCSKIGEKEEQQAADETLIVVNELAVDDTLIIVNELIVESVPAEESFAVVEHPAEESFAVVEQPAEESFAVVENPAEESFAVVENPSKPPDDDVDHPPDESFALVSSPEEKDETPPEDVDKPPEGGDQPEVLESKCQKGCVCAGFKINLYINNMGNLTDGNDPAQKTRIELNVLPGLERIEVNAIPEIVEEEEEEIVYDDECTEECCASKELENRFPGAKRKNFTLPDGRKTTCPAISYRVKKEGFLDYDSQESVINDEEIKCICESNADKGVAGSKRSIVEELVERTFIASLTKTPTSDRNIGGTCTSNRSIGGTSSNRSIGGISSNRSIGGTSKEPSGSVRGAGGSTTGAKEVEKVASGVGSKSASVANAGSASKTEPAKLSLLARAVRLSSTLRNKARKSSKEEKKPEESDEEDSPCSCGNEMLKDFGAKPKRTCTCGTSDDDETPDFRATSGPTKQPVEEEEEQSVIFEVPMVRYDKVDTDEAMPGSDIVETDGKAASPKGVSSIGSAALSDLEDQIIRESGTNTTEDKYTLEGEDQFGEGESGGRLAQESSTAGNVQSGSAVGVRCATAGRRRPKGDDQNEEDEEPRVDIFCKKTRVVKRKSHELLNTKAMSISNLLDGNILALVSKYTDGFNVILNIKNPNETKDKPEDKTPKVLPPCKCDPIRPTPICECNKMQTSPRNQQNLFSDDEYETCSEGPSTARSRRGPEMTNAGPSANAQLTLPDNTVLNLRVTLDMKDIENICGAMKDGDGRKTPTKTRSARGVPATGMKNQPSTVSTGTAILPHRTPKLYDIGDSPPDGAQLSKTFLKEVNSYLFTESSRTINILTPSMTSRASYLSTRPTFTENNPDPVVLANTLANKESVSGKKVDQTVSFRTRFRNTVEYASDLFEKLNASEVMIKNEIRITSSQSMPQIAEGEGASCTKRTCANLKKVDMKPCTCQTEGLKAAPSSTKQKTPKSDEPYQEKPDIVYMAYRACEEELKPINIALTKLKKELKTLNMPEVDCIFAKETMPQLPRMSYFQQKVRELNRNAESKYAPLPSPIIQLRLTPTPSKASQAATGMKTKTRIKFNDEQNDKRIPAIMSRTYFYSSSPTDNDTSTRPCSSRSSKRNANSNSKNKHSSGICPSNRSHQVDQGPRIISTTKVKLPRTGSNTYQNYDSTSNRSYGGKIMGATPTIASRTVIQPECPRIFSNTKMKMPQNPNSNLYQGYGSSYCNTSKTKFPQTTGGYDYYQPGSSKISPNFDSAYHSYPNSSGCNYSGSSFPEQKQRYVSRTKFKMHVNDKGIQIQNSPSRLCKTKVKVMSNHSLHTNLSGSSDHDRSASSTSNCSNVSCVSSEEFVCPSTHPCPSERKGQKRKHSSRTSCSSSNVSVCPFLEAMMSVLSVKQKPRKKGRHCPNSESGSSNVKYKPCSN